jgi:hypothetical protein
MLGSPRRALAIVAVIASSALAGPLVAQGAKGAPAKPAESGLFQSGPIYAGPRLWVGNLNGAVAIGGQAERGFTQPGAYGPGIISGGVGVDWYSWSQSYTRVGEYKYTVIPIQVFSNYHFVIEKNKKLDPYVGLALVYSHYSASWSGSAALPGGVSASASTTAFAGQGGLRYFMSDNLALQGQVGFGYGTLSAGVTWRF